MISYIITYFLQVLYVNVEQEDSIDRIVLIRLIKRSKYFNLAIIDNLALQPPLTSPLLRFHNLFCLHNVFRACSTGNAGIGDCQSCRDATVLSCKLCI